LGGAALHAADARGLRARLRAADVAAYRAIRGLARDPSQVAAVKRFSALGEHGILWLSLGAAGAAIDRPRRGRWVRATATIGAGYALSTSIKLATRRRRPALEDLPALTGTPTGLSFPSSHATSSFAAARAFRRLVPPGALYAVAVPMAASRLYLGVHYPSDIAAGALLGTLVGSLSR
jgi:undecaprenyl-diphosphatase